MFESRSLLEKIVKKNKGWPTKSLQLDKNLQCIYSIRIYDVFIFDICKEGKKYWSLIFVSFS